MPLADLFYLARLAPTATKLISIAKRAADGDPAALDYLKRQGWHEALELLQPGAGDTAQVIIEQTRQAARNIEQALNGNVIDAQYRVLDSAPWSGFLERLIGQRHGAHIILGPVGSGKTSLALKLAQRYQAEHGYRVECVQMYGEDKPSWAVTISRETLVKRMQRLAAHLDGLAEDDDESESKSEPAPMPPTERVIVIDEASLGLSNNPNDPARRAAIQALASCRHLSWQVVYIGQWAGLLPLSLLGQSVVWVKKPDGREQYTDRDNPAVRDLWARASEAFRELQSSPWYTEPYRDPRAWAYCDCASLAGKTGYHGMVPFTPASDTTEADYEEVKEASD